MVELSVKVMYFLDQEVNMWCILGQSNIFSMPHWSVSQTEEQKNEK